MPFTQSMVARKLGREKKSTAGVGGGGASERFTGKSFLARLPPALSIFFCVRSNFRATRTWKKFFIRGGTLVKQDISTQMLMHNAGSGA